MTIKSLIHSHLLFLGMFSYPLLAKDVAQTVLPVRAEVSSGCMVKNSVLDFGAFPSGSGVSASTSIFVVCSNVSGQASISLNLGQNEIGGQRYMSDGKGNKLAYQLYQDASYSRAWKDKSNSKTVPAMELLQGQSYSLFGKIESGQKVLAGQYRDTVTVSIEL